MFSNLRLPFSLAMTKAGVTGGLVRSDDDIVRDALADASACLSSTLDSSLRKVAVRGMSAMLTARSMLTNPAAWTNKGTKQGNR